MTRTTTVQTTVDEELLARIERLRRSLGPVPSMHFSRSKIVRAALEHGVAHLEAFVVARDAKPELAVQDVSADSPKHR